MKVKIFEIVNEQMELLLSHDVPVVPRTDEFIELPVKRDEYFRTYKVLSVTHGLLQGVVELIVEPTSKRRPIEE